MGRSHTPRILVQSSHTHAHTHAHTHTHANIHTHARTQRLPRVIFSLDTCISPPPLAATNHLHPRCVNSTSTRTKKTRSSTTLSRQVSAKNCVYSVCVCARQATELPECDIQEQRPFFPPLRHDVCVCTEPLLAPFFRAMHPRTHTRPFPLERCLSSASHPLPLSQTKPSLTARHVARLFALRRGSVSRRAGKRCLCALLLQTAARPPRNSWLAFRAA